MVMPYSDLPLGLRSPVIEALIIAQIVGYALHDALEIKEALYIKILTLVMEDNVSLLVSYDLSISIT